MTADFEPKPRRDDDDLDVLRLRSNDPANVVWRSRRDLSKHPSREAEPMKVRACNEVGSYGTLPLGFIEYETLHSHFQYLNAVDFDDCGVDLWRVERSQEELIQDCRGTTIGGV